MDCSGFWISNCVFIVSWCLWNVLIWEILGVSDENLVNCCGYENVWLGENGFWGILVLFFERYVVWVNWNFCG